MGVVYEAEQVPLGRRVALKVLPSTASLDPRQRQRFRIEAKRRPCCTTSTSCQSLRSVATRGSITMPCSSSRGDPERSHPRSAATGTKQDG